MVRWDREQRRTLAGILGELANLVAAAFVLGQFLGQRGPSWSLLLAGGGTAGGQVIGSSDRLAAAPRDRPMTPADLAVMVQRTLGINLTA